VSNWRIHYHLLMHDGLQMIGQHKYQSLNIILIVVYKAYINAYLVTIYLLESSFYNRLRTCNTGTMCRVVRFWGYSVTKPPTPQFFPNFSGHFDTHFVLLCFQPQSHQPQGSGSPASEIRLPASAVRLNTTCHQDRLVHHLPPCQSPYETSLHTAV
jgi:hypothetical protein